MFIWDKDIGARSKNEDGSTLNSELEAMEVMGFLKELYEDTKNKNKNKNLKTKLKAAEFSGKLKMFYFVISFMLIFILF